MCKCTIYREEMKRDLMKIYAEVASQYSCQGQVEAYEKVVNHPAPRFYIDARRAYQNIAPLLRGDYSKLEKMNKLKQQMYRDLFEVVMRLTQKPRFWDKSPYYVVRYAVLEPAPRFYITGIRMGQIYNEYKREKLKR